LIDNGRRRGPTGVRKFAGGGKQLGQQLSRSFSGQSGKVFFASLIACGQVLIWSHEG
jgi:hypothetical protein